MLEYQERYENLKLEELAENSLKMLFDDLDSFRSK